MCLVTHQSKATTLKVTDGENDSINLFNLNIAYILERRFQTCLSAGVHISNYHVHTYKLSSTFSFIALFFLSKISMSVRKKTKAIILCDERRE